MGLEDTYDVANNLKHMYHTDALEYYLNFGQSYDDLIGGIEEQDFENYNKNDEDKSSKKGKEEVLISRFKARVIT